MLSEGIINVNKPAGMTSHDCIYVLRRLTGIKRIGHTGTLDPNATGVLPICIGSCARVSEYTDLDLKKYRCSMVLGLETETQDIWGDVVVDLRKTLIEKQKFGSGMSTETIRNAFGGIYGLITQYPPKYSAIKIDGKRLYEYARAGIEVDIKPRTVYISSLDIESIDLETLTITYTVECSKGTYIRTICQDVGKALGVGAAMSELTRISSGVFKIENSVDLEYLRKLQKRKEYLKKIIDGEDFEKVALPIVDIEFSNPKEEIEKIDEKVEKFVLTPDYPLVHFGKVVIKTQERAMWFVNGGHLRMDEVDILRKPEYKEKTPHIEVREEYKDAYNVYKLKEDGSKGELFLGVAFYNYQYKKLVADKIFAR